MAAVCSCGAGGARVWWDDAGHENGESIRALAFSSDSGVTFTDGNVDAFPGNPGTDTQGAMVYSGGQFFVGSPWGVHRHQLLQRLRPPVRRRGPARHHGLHPRHLLGHEGHSDPVVIRTAGPRARGGNAGPRHKPRLVRHWGRAPPARSVETNSSPLRVCEKGVRGRRRRVVTGTGPRMLRVCAAQRELRCARVRSS